MSIRSVVKFLKHLITSGEFPHENNHSFIPEDELEDWVVPGEALDALAALVESFLSRF